MNGDFGMDDRAALDEFSGTDTDSRGSWETLSYYTDDDLDDFEEPGAIAAAVNGPVDVDARSFVDDGIVADVKPEDQVRVIYVLTNPDRNTDDDWAGSDGDDEADDDEDDDDDDDDDEEGHYVLDEAEDAKANGENDYEVGDDGADGQRNVVERQYTMADLDPRDRWLLDRETLPTITAHYTLKRHPPAVCYNFIRYGYDELIANENGYLSSNDKFDLSLLTPRPSENNDMPFVTAGRKRRERYAKFCVMSMVHEYYQNQRRVYDEAFELEMKRAQLLATELVHVGFVEQYVAAHKTHALAMVRNPAYARVVQALQLPVELRQGAHGTGEQPGNQDAGLFQKWWFGVSAEEVDSMAIRPNASRTVMLKQTLLEKVSSAWREVAEAEYIQSDRLHRCWMTPIRWVECHEPNGGIAALAMVIRPLKNCEVAVGGGVSGGDGTPDGLEEDLVVKRWVAKALSVGKTFTRNNIPPINSELVEVISTGELLRLTISLEVSGRGEILAMKVMGFLAKLFIGRLYKVIEKKGDLMETLSGYTGKFTPFTVVHHLIKGHRILVCYDAGKYGNPEQNGGINPRWAVLCGVIVEKPSAPDESPANSGPGPQDAWVVARTGMNDQYSVWSLKQLAASNRQMRGMPSQWFSGPAPSGAMAEAMRDQDLTHRDAFDLSQTKRGRELAQRLAQGDYDFAGLERQCPHAADSWRSAARALRCLWLDRAQSHWLKKQVREVVAKYGVPVREPGARSSLVPEGEEEKDEDNGGMDEEELRRQYQASSYSPLSPPTTPPRTPSPMPGPEDLFDSPCHFGKQFSLENTLACQYVIMETRGEITADFLYENPLAPARMIFDFKP